jgi:hypothetical protein
MLIPELVARFRKEIVLTGSALYETVMAIAERVNRKVQVLRLHGQATHHLGAIQTLQRHIGRQVAHHFGSLEPTLRQQRPSMAAMDTALSTAATRLRHCREELVRTEARIRELRSEVAHEDLLAVQRDLALREAVLERVVVGKGAPILGHPLQDMAMPATARIAVVFRGPFVVPLSDELLLRPGDVILLAGLRADVEQLLPYFHRQVSSKTAS